MSRITTSAPHLDVQPHTSQWQAERARGEIQPMADGPDFFREALLMIGFAGSVVCGGLLWAVLP